MTRIGISTISELLLERDIKPLEQGTPDLPPQPGKHPCVGRDYEYVRHGTLSVLAGIDLVTGTVIGTVEDRRRSQEFVAFLQNSTVWTRPR